MDKELINELMEGFSLENGNIIKCMARENLHDLMEDHIQENMLMIKKKDMEFLPGLMVLFK